MDEDDQIIYVLWKAGFPLRSIGRVFELHPQEVKNIALKVAKQLKRFTSIPAKPFIKPTPGTKVGSGDE